MIFFKLSSSRDWSEHMLARCSLGTRCFWWCSGSGFGVRAHARTRSCSGLMLGEYSASINVSRMWKLKHQKRKNKLFSPLYKLTKKISIEKVKHKIEVKNEITKINFFCKFEGRKKFHSLYEGCSKSLLVLARSLDLK